MTACMTSAVWFPRVEMLFRHCDIQLGSGLSGCQGLFAMGMFNGWELTSHLQNVLLQIVLFFLQTFAIWHPPVHSSSQM